MRILHVIYFTHTATLIRAAPAHTCQKLGYISRQESNQLLAGLRAEDQPSNIPVSDELKKRQSSNPVPNEGLPGLVESSGGPLHISNEGYGAGPRRPASSGNLNERLWQGSFSDASAFAARHTGEVSVRASKGLCKFFKVCGVGIAKYGAEFFRRLFTLNLDIADRNTIEGKREINKIALQNFVTFATILSIFSGTLWSVGKDYWRRNETHRGKRADDIKSQAINFKIDWRDGPPPVKNPVAVIRQFTPGSAPLNKLDAQILYLDKTGEYSYSNGTKALLSGGTNHRARDSSNLRDLTPVESIGTTTPPIPPSPLPSKPPGLLLSKSPGSLQPKPPERSTSNIDIGELEDPPEVEDFRRASSNIRHDKLARRDLRGATNCTPTTNYDFYKLLKHIWLAVIFPALQSGESVIQVMMAGPDSGSEYLLVNGGDMILTVWVTEEPDKETLLSSDPLSPVWLKSQDLTPLKNAECYPAEIPKDADAKPIGPSISWWGKFFDICKASFGSDTAKVIPQDFLYAGQPVDPEERGYGAGWYGKFIAGGCQQKYSCEDLLGVAGNGQQEDAYKFTRQCMEKTPDGIFHGGVFYHQVPALEGTGTIPCGYMELRPLLDYMGSQVKE